MCILLLIRFKSSSTIKLQKHIYTPTALARYTESDVFQFSLGILGIALKDANLFLCFPNSLATRTESLHGLAPSLKCPFTFHDSSISGIIACVLLHVPSFLKFCNKVDKVMLSLIDEDSRYFFAKHDRTMKKAQTVWYAHCCQKDAKIEC